MSTTDVRMSFAVIIDFVCEEYEGIEKSLQWHGQKLSTVNESVIGGCDDAHEGEDEGKCEGDDVPGSLD